MSLMDYCLAISATFCIFKTWTDLAIYKIQIEKKEWWAKWGIGFWKIVHISGLKYIKYMLCQIITITTQNRRHCLLYISSRSCDESFTISSHDLDEMLGRQFLIMSSHNSLLIGSLNDFSNCIVMKYAEIFFLFFYVLFFHFFWFRVNILPFRPSWYARRKVTMAL